VAGAALLATSVAAIRIAAAKLTGKRFADGLTPGINMGLVEFAAGAMLLVAPTTDRTATDRAIDTLQPQLRTATGEGILTSPM
jgi:Ca-activated chloride channel family protein